MNVNENETKTVLIVDDEKNICELIRIYVEKEGFKTVQANDGDVAVEMFRLIKPDIILLDVMMPKKDGWQVCREIREESNVPIIMLTAKGETVDKVLGLGFGADDYIVKPFEPKELVARIKAVLRRFDVSESIKEEKEAELTYEGLTINQTTYEVYLDGELVEMPPKEFELLYYLAKNPNKVFTRNQLLDEVWGYEFFGDSRTVDVHIKRIREKIEKGERPWKLKTIWSVGYKFSTE